MYIQRSAYWPAAGHFPRDFGRVFSRLFDEAGNDQSDVGASEWAPRVDIREEDKRFVIEADIPGVDPKAIEISMDKGVLSLEGERKSEHKAEDGKFTRVERVHGVFHRRFALPDSADADGIRATGKHGVLEIEIPKRPEAAPRKIEIAVE
ncbi:MAG: Hsp20/alpha crystallin family protein [Rhodanobacteraceae bacterium]|nr:MAG: Hsp20/alpha crystallin family protein [Rhodanobacteraceae bacterium]